MSNILNKLVSKSTGIFIGGVAFGTAGIKILTSKDAKKVYTGCTAAVLRAKDVVLDVASKLQDNCEDIYAEAKNINEKRAAEADVVDDAIEEAVVEEAAEE